MKAEREAARQKERDEATASAQRTLAILCTTAPAASEPLRVCWDRTKPRSRHEWQPVLLDLLLIPETQLAEAAASTAAAPKLIYPPRHLRETAENIKHDRETSAHILIDRLRRYGFSPSEIREHVKLCGFDPSIVPALPSRAPAAPKAPTSHEVWDDF